MPFAAYVLIALAAALAGAYVYWRLRYGPPAAGSIPILAYHKVDGRFELGGTRVTPAQFARQMRYLKGAGYTAVTLSRAVELMRSGMITNEKHVCLTFDDAYEGLFTNAWPVLRECGFGATIFALTGFIGRENTWDINWLGLRFRHLSLDQMRQMQAAGIEFGSHGASHRDLRFLSDEDLEREVADSKRILEQGLGVAVRAFSYPFGRYDDRVMLTFSRCVAVASTSPTRCGTCAPRSTSARHCSGSRTCSPAASTSAPAARRWSSGSRRAVPVRRHSPFLHSWLPAKRHNQRMRSFLR
jgi:peptidoglycan/xylan/chitin deacetylase (PgdA/CDA1 family)